MNLPYPFSESNIHLAKVKAAEIKLDILKGTFDISLNKYRQSDQIVANPDISVIQLAPVVNTSEVVQVAVKPNKESLGELVDDFVYWTKHIKK